MIKDIGVKYNRVTVLSILERATDNVCAKVLGICECGSIKPYWVNNLRKGHTKSCGCQKSINAGHHIGSHGLYGGPKWKKEFQAWSAAKSRCFNKNNKSYHQYGGRGIEVCDRWMYHFDKFVEDMGHCPDGFSLERIDNSKGYSPENCRWASIEDQQQNRRDTVRITYDGACMSVTKACRLSGVSKSTFYYRFRKVNQDKSLAQKCFDDLLPGRRCRSLSSCSRT